MIVDPDPLLAPVIPPVIVPIVQANELGVEAVNEILGPVPLHIVAVFAVVTEGVGFTVTVIGLLVEGLPIAQGVRFDVKTTVTTQPF